MSMDLTAAKGVLQRVAEQYKAARDLGDALEALTDLEGQRNMLTNNVEHLQKEQASLTADQTAQRQAMKDESVRIQKDHAAKSQALASQRQVVEADIQRTKDEATQAILDRMATANTAIANEEDKLKGLQTQRMALEQELGTLGQQLEEMKAKMRQFVS